MMFRQFLLLEYYCNEASIFNERSSGSIVKYLCNDLPVISLYRKIEGERGRERTREEDKGKERKRENVRERNRGEERGREKERRK
jgi:hypothetical protein